MQPRKYTRSDKMLMVAMQNPEEWVCQIQYMDSRKQLTNRTVSPIRFNGDAVLVYCLSRDGLRSLKLTGILGVKLRHASDVMTPEALQVLLSARPA